MIVGYARTSTVSQVAGLEGRIREPEAAGCERIFSEQTSAVGPRPILDQALAFVRQSDVFTVTKPDRLARSTADGEHRRCSHQARNPSPYPVDGWDGAGYIPGYVKAYAHHTGCNGDLRA